MRGWYAVFHKEIAGFFSVPVAYAVTGSFLLLAGFFFWANVSFMNLISLQAANSPMLMQRINLTDVVVRPLVQNMAIVLLFVMPLLTMRIFSEEKKTGTIELLLTYPVSDLAVIMGKYLAAVFLLLVILAGTAPFLVILLMLGVPDWGPLVGGYLGLLLLGSAFLSLGMFISSLTENQIVSAIVSFGAALLFWVMSWTATFVDEQFATVINQLSMLWHMESLNKGVIPLSDISYFVLFTAFFLFMTTRSVESYRWRG